MKYLPIIFLIYALVACNNDIPEDSQLAWQYDHSTDVAQFQLLGTAPVELEGQKCNAIVWEVEAIQAFKGNLKRGEIIQVWGPNTPDYWNIGGERLMFLRMYEGEAYDSCSTRLFKDFKQVHWSCCEITGIGEDAKVLFQTMSTSEHRGPDIPVDANKVFGVLRSYETQQP